MHQYLLIFRTDTRKLDLPFNDPGQIPVTDLAVASLYDLAFQCSAMAPEIMKDAASLSQERLQEMMTKVEDIRSKFEMSLPMDAQHNHALVVLLHNTEKVCIFCFNFPLVLLRN